MSGTVFLVGAGPGDPKLITVRGAEVLGLADVVVFDRLASPALLDLPPARAERIYLQLRGEQREWLGRQILEYESVLDKQDPRAIEPVRQQFEKIIDEIERDSYIGPPS